MDPRPFKELYLPAELDKYQREANKRLKNPDYDAKFLEWKYGKERWEWMRASYYAPQRPKCIPPCPSLEEAWKDSGSGSKRKAESVADPEVSDATAKPSTEAKQFKPDSHGDHE